MTTRHQRWSSCPGFTLLEVLIGVAVITLAMSLVVNSVFQTLSIQRYWRDDVVAVRDMRHAASWFAGDALMAEATDLVDGASPVQQVTFTRTGSDAVVHTVMYSRSGDTLVRDLDGNQIILARRIQSVGFSRSGKTLSFAIQVAGGQGTLEGLSLQTYMRLLQ